jgi:hypothetical protein
MKHPTIADIEKYSRGDMGFFKRRLTGIHVNKCSQCVAMLEKLREDDKLLKEIKLAVIKQPEPDMGESDSTFVSIRKVLGGKGHSST